MAVSKAPLSHQHEQNCVVLPLYHPAKDSCRRHIIIIVILFLIATLFYALWPSDPTLKIVRLHLNKIRVHTFPIVNVDISLNVTLKVRNVDAYSMDFTSLEVAVKYRGKKLGHARSGGGHVRALATSDLAAELEFSGVRVLSDVVALLEDLAKGKVPFDTVTEVTGKFGFLFFEFPLKVKLWCGILVNTNNQTIVCQNCYPAR